MSQGVTYSSDYYNGVHTGQMYLVRLVSCVSLHAIWVASVAIWLFNHRDTLESDNCWGVLLQAILIPMMLRGPYDTLLKKDMDLWALATAA